MLHVTSTDNGKDLLVTWFFFWSQIPQAQCTFRTCCQTPRKWQTFWRTCLDKLLPLRSWPLPSILSWWDLSHFCSGHFHWFWDFSFYCCVQFHFKIIIVCAVSCVSCFYQYLLSGWKRNVCCVGNKELALTVQGAVSSSHFCSRMLLLVSWACMLFTDLARNVVWRWQLVKHRNLLYIAQNSAVIYFFKVCQTFWKMATTFMVINYSKFAEDDKS